MNKRIKELKDFANEDIDPKWIRIAKNMKVSEKEYMKVYLELKLERMK